MSNLTVGDLMPGDVFVHPLVRKRTGRLLLCISTEQTTVDTQVGPLCIPIAARLVRFIDGTSMCDETWKAGMDVEVTSR